MTIYACLCFNGNCGEAMAFYHNCLGGDLHVQTAGEAPGGNRLPDAMKRMVLQATLVKGDMILMGTDLASEYGLRHGNNLSLMLVCSSAAELHRCYESLSAGGRRTQPVSAGFRGALSGNLTDPFGNDWQLHFQQP